MFTSFTLPGSIKRHSLDNREEKTTSNSKRMKQDSDVPSFNGNDEHLFIQSEASLHNIVSGVIDLLENNRCEETPWFQGKSYFESATMTQSAQANRILVLDDIETNEVLLKYENIQPLPTSAHGRKREISVLSSTGQVQIEQKLAMIRNVQSPDTGTTNGLAIDHNFYPKVVGVESLSSRLPHLTSAKKQSHSPKTSGSQPPLEKLDQGKQMNNPLKRHKDTTIFDVNTSRASCANPALINSPTTSSTQTQNCPVLFTFKQKDGQKDIFLVVNDNVFSVRCYEYKGESFLVHTDGNGKKSILAKLPKRANTTSKIGDAGCPSSKQFSNMESETTSTLSSLSEQPEHRFYQRVALHSSTKAPVTITPVRSNFVQTLNADTRKPGEPLPANSNLRLVSGKITKLLQDKRNRAMLNANKVYSEHQGVNGGIRVASDDALILERQRLQNKVNEMKTDEFEHRQLPSSIFLLQRPHVGQQYPNPQTMTNRNPRHDLVANDTLQTSTAIKTKAMYGPKTGNVSLDCSTGNAWARYQRSKAVDVHLEQHTNTIAQKRNGHQSNLSKETVNAESDGSNSSYTTPEEERRIQNKLMLLNYIPNQPASSEESSPPTTDVLANRRSDAANTRTNCNGTIPKVSIRKLTPQTTTRVQMVPRRQSQDANETRGWRYCDPSLGKKLENFNPHERRPANQMAQQNSALLVTQPCSSAPLYSSDLEESDEIDEVDAVKQVLRVIDSWQQRVCPNNDSPQIKQLLVGTAVSGVTTQTTASTRTSSANVATENARAVKNSSQTGQIPVISQVFGRRSAGGENALPKRTATVHVIDSKIPIYVDANGSVIHKERTLGFSG